MFDRLVGIVIVVLAPFLFLSAGVWIGRATDRPPAPIVVRAPTPSPAPTCWIATTTYPPAGGTRTVTTPC